MTDADDPYGRQAPIDALTDWREREARQMAERAAQAARSIAAREAEAAANVDPDTMAEFERVVAEKAAQLLADGIGEPPPWPNPLSPYLIDWGEFWTTDHDETEWLLEPLFADGRAHALYAGAKTGKSFVLLAACAALATGRPFLRHPRGPGEHVLYVDYEMSPQDVRERLEGFGYGPDDDLSRLHYALLPSIPPLDTDEGGRALLEAAQAVHARFVVIDTTSRAIQGDENDADTLRAFYRCTGLRLKQAGIGWMRLDHAGKDAAKGQRGTSAKNDDVDVVVRIVRTDGGQRWEATHRRMAWYPEVVDIDVKEGDDGVTRFTGAMQMWPEGTKRIAELLDSLDVPLTATRSEARRYLDEAGETAQNKVLGPALKWRKQEAQRRADEAAEALSGRLLRKADRAADRDFGPSADQPADQNQKPCKQRADRGADQGGPGSAAEADRPASHVMDAAGPAGPIQADEGPYDDDPELF